MPPLVKHLIDTLLDERERWLLWLPVFMGLGIALYFTGHSEPVLWPALVVMAVLAGAAIIVRHSLWLPVVLMTFMIALGFAAAKVETLTMAEPMLQVAIDNAQVHGRVMAISRVPDGYKLALENVVVDGLPPDKTPRMIYAKFRYQTKLPRLGAMINVKAVLHPLSGPVEPGAFNFRRFAYFQGYGATGFALGYWHYEVRSEPSFYQRLALFFEVTRNIIRERMLGFGDGADTAVAVAMITGDQTNIPKGTMQAMRISGISHILSVSGLHIAMVAGTVFFMLRALMALWPWVALHWPIKKIAAFAALIAAVIYTLICAAPIPAVRSMLMTGLVLLAVMVDRRALTMRLIAFAAFICLLFAPSALLDVSFQLSFGAVMALVAAFEDKENALLKRFKGEGWLGKTGFYIAGSVLTSLVASAATAPFILYYFQQVNWYGVITNLIAVPLSSFIIMPAALASVLLMPFGWDAPFLWIMRLGVQWMLKSAEWVSLLPGAATYHPAMGFGFLLAATFGGLWLCLWRKRWRYLGIFPLVIGTLGFLVTPRPDVLVAEDGITVAARNTDGQLVIRARDQDDFYAKAWRQREGLQGPDAAVSPNWFDAIRTGEAMGALSCEKTGDCMMGLHGQGVAFPMTDAGMTGMCAHADVVIGVNAKCPGIVVIDRARAAAEGSHALYVSRDKITVKSAMDAVRKRPWE